MNHLITAEVSEIDHKRVMNASHAMNKPSGSQVGTNAQISIREAEERVKVEQLHTRLTTLAHRISH